MSSLRLVGNNMAFIVIRDGKGETQAYLEAGSDDQGEQVLKVLKSTPLESIISIKGIVQARPESQRKQTATGDIEVIANQIQVVNRAEGLPFSFHRSEAEEVGFHIPSCLTLDQ